MKTWQRNFDRRLSSMEAVVPVSNEVQSGTHQHSSIRLQEEVDRLSGDIVSCLQQLVRIPSITGSEAEIAEHIAQLLRGMKMQVQVLERSEERRVGKDGRARL